MDGILFGESIRWRDDRIWFADWAAHEIIRLDPDGSSEVAAVVESFPLCFDFLPDGQMLVVDSSTRRLLVRQPDGSLATRADLAPVCEKPWNDIVIDRRGNAYVDNINFDFPAGEPAPGLVALVSPDGDIRVAAYDFAFPNGMAITPDGATLLVAESHASRISALSIASDGSLTERRVWADTPGDHPDGICLDAEGALWYADVGNRRCVRVREGGEVLDLAESDRGAFDCTLNLDAADPKLYVVGQEYGRPGGGEPTGQVLEFTAPAPGITTR